MINVLCQTVNHSPLIQMTSRFDQRIFSCFFRLPFHAKLSLTKLMLPRCISCLFFLLTPAGLSCSTGCFFFFRHSGKEITSLTEKIAIFQVPSGHDSAMQVFVLNVLFLNIQPQNIGNNVVNSHVPLSSFNKVPLPYIYLANYFVTNSR